MTKEQGNQVQRPEWRADALWFGLIFVVALTLRWIYLLQARTNPYFDAPVMDPLFHHQWAQAFARGETFWNEAYFRAPLYPWFLGVIYKLFGSDNLIIPRIVQIVIGSLSCGLTYLVGKQAFSRAVGALAGLTAATYWIFMYFEGELLLPVLLVFLDLLLLWALLWSRERNSRSAWLLCGLLLGVSAIARPNILLLAPALVAWIFVLQRPNWKRAAGYSFCLFLGTIAPIVPITIRNYVVGHDVALIATQGGVNFYIGNNPNSNGITAVILGDPAAWEPCYAAQIARAEKAEGRKLKASEVSRWYFRQTLRFFVQQPAKAARLMLRKLEYFWSHLEIANNQDVYFVAEYYAPISRWLPVGFWLVGPLGVLGLCLSLARARQLFPLWGFVLIYMVSVVLFFICARYRVPILPVLMILGAHAVVWLWETLHGRRWGKLTAAAAVLAAMGCVVARAPADSEVATLQQHESTGLRLVDQDRFAEAEHVLSELIRRADAINEPLDAKNFYWLGFARVKLEKYTEALPCFDRALRLRPFYPEVRTQYGYALAVLGRLDEAAVQFEQLVRDVPDSGPARINLGITLVQLGRFDEALPHWIRALELLPRSETTLLVTLEPLQENGRRADVLRLLRPLAERFPERPLVSAALIRTLADSDESDLRAEAVRRGREAVSRSNDNATLLAAVAWAEYRNGDRAEARRLAQRALQIARQSGDTRAGRDIERELRQYETQGQP